MKRFCPKCGKETNKLIEKVCLGCYLEKIEIPLPKIINLEVCKTCNRIKFRRKMHELDENILREIILANLKTDLDIREAVLDFEETCNGYDVTVDLVIAVDTVLFAKKIGTKLKLAKFLCDSCMKLVSNYFEATIQLRDFDNDDELIKETELFLARAKNRDNLSAITGIGKKKEGVDIKIGSLRIAKRLARHLLNKYGATLKITDSIAGFDKNLNKPKKKYTFCLRKN